MTDQPPRRIPEWLSLQDISRAWSAETGESVTAFEERFRAWFKDFLLRNDYGDAGTEESGVPEQMLEGRQIWRETFETFCEERGLAKPRFWFPEAGETRVPPEAVAALAPSADLVEPIADAAKPRKKKQEKPPPRRRAREGGTSFTWIAAGLVAAVVAGLAALWMQDMDQPMVEAEAAGQGQPDLLVATALSPEFASAATGLAAPAAAPIADTQTPVMTAPEAAPEAVPEVAPEAAILEPEAVLGPAPTTADEPAAAQVAAAALANDRPPALSVTPATLPAGATAEAAAAETPMPSEPPDAGLIVLIQRELQAAGFDPGPLDGKLGTRLAAAITTYQRANGLLANGRPSVDLLSRLARENLKAGRSLALLPPPETLTEKMTSAVAAGEGGDRKAALKSPSLHPIPTPSGRSLVRSIQERLADRGYYSGPIDGSLGSKTRAAIRAYQRVQRDPATGQPSAAMFEELEDYALEARGLDQFRKGAYEAAILTYSRIIQRKPKYADAYFNRGLAYNNSGHREQALADYEKAIQLDPEHNRAYLDRANIRYQQGLYRDAARDYFKALKLWIGMG